MIIFSVVHLFECEVLGVAILLNEVNMHGMIDMCKIINGLCKPNKLCPFNILFPTVLKTALNSL
jgi:hypothetical protein